MAVMRKIRDDLGTDLFKPFTDLINYFTVPQYNLKIDVQGTVRVEKAWKSRTPRSETWPASLSKTQFRRPAQ